MNHANPIASAGLLTLTLLPLMALRAQEPERQPAYRDFSDLQRLRVVCEHKHFGRVLDLIADVPSGKITSAVVTMSTDVGGLTVVVPYELLQYEAQDNLLHLGPCLEDDAPHPAFDAAKIKVTESKRDDGTVQVTGTMLVSRIRSSRVQLTGETQALVQGVTIELASGHVAFAHLAVKERAGDQELHPAPWSALQLLPTSKDTRPNAPVLALPMDKARLEATPSLVEIILQDALYRPLVYKAFAVAPPVFDRK